MEQKIKQGEQLNQQYTVIYDGGSFHSRGGEAPVLAASLSCPEGKRYGALCSIGFILGTLALVLYYCVISIHNDALLAFLGLSGLGAVLEESAAAYVLAWGVCIVLALMPVYCLFEKYDRKYTRLDVFTGMTMTYFAYHMGLPPLRNRSTPGHVSDGQLFAAVSVAKIKAAKTFFSGLIRVHILTEGEPESIFSDRNGFQKKILLSEGDYGRLKKYLAGYKVKYEEKL